MLAAVFTHGKRMRRHAQLLPWGSDPPARSSSSEMLCVSSTHPMWSSVSACVLTPDTVSFTWLLFLAVLFAQIQA